MLVNTKAELMYPSLEGLAGLGCVDCFSTCGCSSDASKGMGSLGDAWESWYCQGFLAPSIFPWCVPPIPNEVLKNDTSMFGKNLTQENRDRATSMAQVIVENDPSLQSDGNNINWWLIGGLALGVVVLVKKI